jgi:Uncharacterised nucleotidyltransferase
VRSPTAWSVSSTAASATARPTTNTLPRGTGFTKLLDRYGPCDVGPPHCHCSTIRTRLNLSGPPRRTESSLEGSADGGRDGIDRVIVTYPPAPLIDLAASRKPAELGDPTELVRAATEHRMSGLLWTHAQTGGANLSQECKVDLAGRDWIVRRRHKTFWTKLPSLLGRFQEAGVDVAVVKGVPAEARWYDRMGERPCVDIDLLVDPAISPSLSTVLEEFGHPLAASFRRLFERGVLPSVDLEVDRVPVDLHFDLLKVGPPSSSTLFWEHTVLYRSPEGFDIRILDAEASLIHLLVHLNVNSFSWLLGFADVARILQREALDWDSVARLAEAEGLQVPVFESLRSVVDTLGLPLADRPPRNLRTRLWRVLWRPAVQLRGDLGWIQLRHRPLWLPLFIRGNVLERVRWWWRQFVLEPILVDMIDPGSLPVPLRLIAGRIRRALARRRSSQRLRIDAAERTQFSNEDNRR